MADERMFPIMEKPPFSIPWSVLQPHEKQAIHNHGQTLKRLAERGGLCASEAIDVLTGQKWATCKLSGADATAKLLSIVDTARQALARAEERDGRTK